MQEPSQIIEHVRKKKQDIIEKLVSKYTVSVTKVRRDHHWRRKPRPCGLTVHITEGCSAGCLYCYVDSPFRVTNLNAAELVLSVLWNPYFVPGKNGTFIAVGAVGDPLDCPDLFVDFVSVFREFMDNPIQFSTKEVNWNLISFIKKNGLDPLVSMCSVFDEVAEKYEPNRPPVSERLEFLKEINGTLFLRPLLPNLGIEHYYKCLDKIAEAGISKVILGNLRLTKRVRRNLGIKELPRSYLLWKEKLEEYGKKEYGLLIFRSSCCSNALKNNVPCFGLCWYTGFCVKCPNRCWDKVEKIDKSEIIKIKEKIRNDKELFVIQTVLRVPLEDRLLAQRLKTK